MKAVGFDLVGTLCRAQTHEDDCIFEMCSELKRNNLKLPDKFLDAYNRTALKYMEIRKRTLREVNNRVWISEALDSLGFRLSQEDEVVRRAADAYFRPYVEKVQVPSYVVPILSDISRSCRIGLVTNFTYAPAVRSILEKNNLTRLFDSIVISDDMGWRKPHPKIFQRFLSDVSVQPADAIFVGDDPRYDFEGAQTLGMSTILLRNVDTNFENSYYQVHVESRCQPHRVLNSLFQVADILK